MTLDQALPYILVGVAILLLVVTFVFFGTRRTTVVGETKGDVLDEGAERARRNEALINAPTAAVPEPQPTPAPAPAPAPSGEADDLRMIKGVGPKLVAILAEQGVTRFEQIAAWSDADVERVDATLGRFAGRIQRDQWVEQAKLLAAGESTAFSEKFGQK